MVYKKSGSEPQILRVGAGAEARDVAYIAHHAGEPGILWLSGFMSDMTSTKATALAAWADANGLSSTRFDFSGHGQSSQRIEDGTIGRWLEEADAVLTRVTKGPQIIVGSSMGGHIALLLLKTLLSTRPADAERVKALLLIAPAWDMTEELMWKRFPEQTRREIIEKGFCRQPSAYAEPYVISRKLIEDGRNHLLARRPFDPGRPVTIVQGLKDVDVPAEHTRELMTFLEGDNVKLIEVPDAEHRLSRPQDIDLLFSELKKLI